MLHCFLCVYKIKMGDSKFIKPDFLFPSILKLIDSQIYQNCGVFFLIEHCKAVYPLYACQFSCKLYFNVFRRQFDINVAFNS